MVRGRGLPLLRAALRRIRTETKPPQFSIWAMADAGFHEYDARYPLLARARDPRSILLQPTQQTQTFSQQTTSTTDTGTFQETTTQETTDVDSDDQARRRRRRILWIILGIVAALIVIGVIVFFLFFRSSTPTNNNTAASGSLNDPCSSTSPCLVLFSCENDVCKSVLNGPCTSNTDCSQSPFGLVCTGQNGAAGQCRHPNGDPCSLPADCVSGVCTSNQCVPCVLNADCATQQTCVSGICQ